MSGHSHAATIKRDKEATDARRGAAFSKIGRLITIAIKTGGGITDPAKNFKLRLALEKAREVNMPKDNIKRAIERGSGKAEAEALETITYEGFGPGGCAIIVECITDNKYRTGAEIKNLFSKGGGNLAEPGAAAHFFQRRGFLKIQKGAKPEELMLKLIDLGAQDIEEKGDFLYIYVPPEQLVDFAQKLVGQNLRVLETEPVMKPKTILDVGDEAKTRVKKFIEELKAHEDVQKVFVNIDL
jgi:YebC/PmpR family DNA-binding regulatory protein